MRKAPSTPGVSRREFLVGLLSGIATTSCAAIDPSKKTLSQRAIAEGAMHEGEFSPLDTCPTMDSNSETQTIYRSRDDIEKHLEEIQDYVDSHRIPLPSFHFREASWEDPDMLSEEEAMGLAVKHCRDLEDWVLSKPDAFQEFTLNTLGAQTPKTVTIKGAEGKESEAPVLTLNCDLVNEKVGVGGLFISHPKTVILVQTGREKDYKDIGIHEAMHLYHSKTFPLNQAEQEQTFRAEELFTPEELALWGLPSCHPANYDMLNEMAADAIQMMLASEEQLNHEWDLAYLRRNTNYRGVNYLQSHLFFEQLNDDEKLKGAVVTSKIPLSKKRMMGELLYILGEKGIKGIYEKIKSRSK